MIEFSKLYKLNGIYRRSELLHPHKKSLSKFKFPRESIWHYLPNEHHHNSVLPDIHDIIDRDKRYLVNLIMQHAVSPKYARMKAVRSEVFYRQAYSQIAELPKADKLDINVYKRNPVLVKNKNDVIVEIYDPIESSYVYKDIPLAPVYKWEDLATTLASNINSISELSPRNHFIFVPIGINIPSYSDFNRAQSYRDRAHLIPFIESNSLFLLELFKWIGGTSEPFKTLSEKSLEKLTLVLCNDTSPTGHYALLNLGWLNGQIKRDPNGERGLLDPVKGQKIIVNLFNQIAITEVEVTPTEDTDELIEEIPTDITDDVEPAPTETLIDTTQDDEDINEDDLDSALERSDVVLKTAKANKDISLNPELAKPYVAKVKSPTEAIDTTIDKLVSSGIYSMAEAKRLKDQARSIDTIKNPFGSGTLGEYLQYDPKALKLERTNNIPDRVTIVDKGMLSCATQEFTSRYVKDHLYKDVLNFATSIQNNGIIVSNVSVEQHENLMDNYYRVKMEVQPVPGKATILPFDIPIPDEEGVYMSGGVKYYLKKQEDELPIRKVSPIRVALTSYMGKVFVDRKSAVKNNYSKWLLNSIMAINLDPNDNRITNVITGKVFDRSVKVPLVYSTLATRYSTFTLVLQDGRKLVLNFDCAHYGSLRYDMAEVGVVQSTNERVYIDSGDNFYINSTPIGTIEELLGFTTESNGRLHLDAVVVNVFGQKVGVGLVLGMELGLSTLIKTLGCRYRRVDAGKARNLSYNEYYIAFKNETFIFDRRDKIATLVLSSFQDYKNSIAKYSSSLFDAKDIYTLLLEESGLTARYYNEIDTIYTMFIDHVTRDLLLDMNMPTDMPLLLLKAVELLSYDSHPDEADTAFMRKRGYERFGGLVYKELVNSIRSMNSKPNNKRRKLELNPMAVKMGIITDSAQEIYQEINPIHALKQSEIVTLGGTGGRSFDALSMNIRGYHKSSLGTISESSVDNKNAGAIVYLSSSPKFNSLRGTSDRYDPKSDVGVSSLLSTSAMLAPGSEHDDPKRIGYTSVQNSHIIPAVGYASLPVVTGEEQTLANKMQNGIFAVPADQDGSVVDVARTYIRVKYKDNSIKCYELGRLFGKAAGETIPHHVRTDYAIGDNFKRGDIITYNDLFFEKDYMLGLVYKGAVPVTVVFSDMAENYEDSNLVAPSFNEKFKTKSTHVRDVTVKFDQHIHHLVTIGQTLTTETPLCIIEEETTANYDDIDPELIASLMALGRNAPSARHTGVVEKIEIRYRGDIEDMNETLAPLAEYHDRALGKHRTNLGKSKLTNKIDDAFRYGKTIVDNNHMLILIYITEEISSGIGDKGVLGNQMKFTIGKTVSDPITTANGTNVDMIFGIRPKDHRMVGHADKVGTANVLLELLAIQALAMYKVT